MATTWSGTTANEWVSCIVLNDAVTTNILVKKSGQTIPNTSQWATRDQILTWLDVTISGSPSATQWINKSSIVANPTNYDIVPGMVSASDPCTYNFSTNYYISKTTPKYCYSDPGLTTPVSNVYLNYTTSDGEVRKSLSGGVIGMATIFYPRIGTPTSFTGLSVNLNTSGTGGATQRFHYLVAGRTYRITATIKTWSSSAASSYKFHATAVPNGSVEQLGLPYINFAINAVSTTTFVAGTCDTYSLGLLPESPLSPPPGTNMNLTYDLLVERLN